MFVIETQHDFENFIDNQPIARALNLPIASLGLAALAELPEPIEAEIKLGIGTFEIDTPDARYLDLTGTHPWYSRILCHQPLPVAHASRLEKLTLRAAGDHACLNIDIAAFSIIENVTFANTLEPQNHINAAWNTVQRRASAIVATPAHDGDNSYGITIRDCGFTFLEYGIDIAASAVNNKGLLQLLVERPTFNGTRFPIRAARIGESHFLFGLYQLHELAIDLDGNYNALFRCHFERGARRAESTPESVRGDIHIQKGSHGNSYGNEILWCDALPDNIWNEGEATTIRHGHNRNMANALDGTGGGKKNKKIAASKRIAKRKKVSP